MSSDNEKTPAQYIESLPEDQNIVTLAGAAEIVGRTRQWAHANVHRFDTARRIPMSATVIVDRSEAETMAGELPVRVRYDEEKENQDS